MQIMIRLIRYLTLVALVVSAAPVGPPSVAWAQEAGTISGVVTNETTGEPLSGVTVTLSKFTSQSPESEDTTVEADASGRYVFANVDAGDGIVYATSVEYAGVLYSSGMIRASGEPDATANLNVYETTTDPSNIRLRDRVVLLSGTNQETGEVNVTDIFNVENLGDRTLVRDDTGRTLQLDVPRIASRVSPRPGFDFGTPSIEGSRVYLTSPIRPGLSTPSLAYDIPYRGTSIDLDLTSPYPTASIRFLVPVSDDGTGPTIESEGTGFRDDGVTTIGDRQYHVWSVTDVSASTVVGVELTGLPRSAVGNRQLWSVEPLVLSVAAVLIAMLITTFVVRQRGLHLPRPIELAPAVAGSLTTRREELAGELRLLESDHQEGRINDSAYQNARRAILLELRGISRAMRGVSPDD